MPKMLLKYASLVFLSLLSVGSYAQDRSIVIVDTLNKRIPLELVDVITKTLEHYPELKDVSIDFVFFNGMHNSFMQAKPKPLSLLSGHKNRVYMVQMMSSMMIEDSIIPIHELPEDALIGWFGHEIGHIVDYESMNVGDIIIFSLKYLFSKQFVMLTEERVDRIAIKHGLGENNIAWKNYVKSQESLPEAYRNKVGKMYIPESEIRKIMRGE